MTEPTHTVAIINTEMPCIVRTQDLVPTVDGLSSKDKVDSSSICPPGHSNIIFNTTFCHTIEDVSFGGLPLSVMIEIFKDGRAFSHFIEAWLAITYPLTHIKRCKQYDHTDVNDETVKYDQKTFTKGGCKYMPSNMIGEGRKFNKEIFEKKAKQLIYIIVSNVHFPEIMVRFVKGCDLLVDYPTGIIPFKDFDKFFH